MANSKYGYVRGFEQPDSLLANTWIVVRIDGRGFSKLTAKYKFNKPNDRRALDLMNAAAKAVMKELPDLVLAYGQSDEFSFVFHKDCVLFERRASKLTTTIVSMFTSYYTFLWSTHFLDTPLTPPLPSFDGRAVSYPSDQNLRDYISWRQVDCHVNNLYNTTFWALVQQGGMDARSAEKELVGTISSDKNEILFSRFGINYNNEPEIYKKGSVLYRDFSSPSESSTPTPPRRTTSPPPLSHPQPRPYTRPISQPLSLPILPKSPSSSGGSTPHGPTFLSTSTTPSPPPSPSSMSIPTFPATPPFPQTFLPVSLPPPTSTAPATTSGTKGPLPLLTPLPLPPPTLKPSTKPPPSLNPPNATAHTNMSPAVSPTAPRTIPSRTTSTATSHTKAASTSASISNTTAQRGTSRTSQTLKHRSPSLSMLEGGPQIPLRISSIPLNNSPRKMSLPSQKSIGMLRANDPATAAGEPGTVAERGVEAGTKKSPPMQTMKELPSPPPDAGDEHETVVGKGNVHVAGNGHGDPALSNIGTLVRPMATRRSQSHSRIGSAPSSSYFPSPPSSSQPFQQPWSPPKPNQGKQKQKKREEKGDAKGRGEMSKSAKEKDRKKRQKARIVMEHVDVIGDGFWERRPWILSGSTS
ncbi:Thg1-domain-containing protein [Zopfia rhizophila CBS 207.26]|uniref:tRNA(His) guanylyltransferase n=1 Tax=Zopfia rhizophila CBS 207.26 TaxID=1314779 RepID=A0A6A6DH24_9PEZI|nr:Thg1-domain-containing protein [Zopfia rhizophila CBS 207.26]